MRHLILSLIFLVAIFLRFWNLGSYPEALDEDEMALGYYGYSLLRSGTDEYGNKFPIYFESAGDYKYGLYSYFAAIPVGILGLNAFSTRFIAALAGSLSVIALYFLALEIFNKGSYALLSSFLLAIEPLHIHFSRVAYNNILGGLFAIISFTFFIKYAKKERFKNILLSFIFFILAIYSYQAYRILMPSVFIVASLLIYFKRVVRRRHWNLIIFSGLTLFIVLFSFISPKSRSRSQNISILFNKPALIERYTEDSIAGNKLLVTRLFHNKYLSLAEGFTKRYLSYFDPVFLFIEASSSTERHTIPSLGFLYLVDAVFICLGLAYLFSKVKEKEKYFLFILVLASPLAASMVVESRSTTRAIFLVIPIVLIVSMGLYSIFQVKKFGKYFLAFSGLIYLASFFYFAHQYLVHKVYHHPWYSDVGLKEMVEVVNQNYPHYSNIVMSHGHYIPYLFYNKVDPQEFLRNSEISPKVLAGELRIKSYGKIIFNMPYECPLAGKKETLYVCFGYQIPQNSKIVKLIRYKDNQPALILVEFGKGSEKNLPERVEYYQDVDKRFAEGVLPNTYETFWPIK